MPNSIFVTESTLTDRYQTTVPVSVRKTLRLCKKEKIRYEIQPDGTVILSRADRDETDPALQSFLSFLAQDIRQNPERLVAVTPDLVSRLNGLVGAIDVDLDAPLDDRDR